MIRRPLIAMSSAYLLLLFAAFGTSAVWAIFIAQLGGGPSATGIFHAVGNLTGVAGTLFSGWLADRTGRRKEIFFASVVLFAGTWFLMSRAATWQQLTVINIFGGFTFSIALNMIVILTGLLATETQRGQSFGLLTFVSGASLLLSGLAVGPIADRWGFPALMLVNGGFCLAALLPGLLFVEPATASRLDHTPADRERRNPVDRDTAGTRRPYYMLIAAAVTYALASFGGNLGRSIAMSERGFSATAISLTTAIGGAISLPAPLVIGWLSDRLGRKGLLLLCLAAGFTALLAFAYASSAWGFWGASVLLAIMASAQPLLQAFATDLLPIQSVGMGLSLLSSATSAGLFISSLGVGVVMQQYGARPAFVGMALAPLLAMVLLARVRERKGVGLRKEGN